MIHFLTILDSLDFCEQGFCLYDREAIACFGNNSHFVLPYQQKKKDLKNPGLIGFLWDAMYGTLHMNIFLTQAHLIQISLPKLSRLL